MTTRRVQSWHEEVVDVRSRIFGSRWDSMLFDVHRRMAELGMLFSGAGNELHRHIVVSSIATLQTFHRGTIVSVVNLEDKYKRRAAQSINEKFSMEDALLWLTGGVATLGELAAHLSSCNNPTDMVSTLGALLEVDMRKALAQAVDPYDMRNGVSGAPPVVEDVDRLLADLAEAFRLRHILAHEAAAELVVGAETAERLWAAVSSWIKAIEAVLWTTAYADEPLTQHEMNVHAGKGLRATRTTLARLLRIARSWATEENRSAWLRSNQRLWSRASADWTRGTYATLDGSMWPSVAAGDAQRTVQARIEQVKAWLNSQDSEKDDWVGEWMREEELQRSLEASLSAEDNLPAGLQRA